MQMRWGIEEEAAFEATPARALAAQPQSIAFSDRLLQDAPRTPEGVARAVPADVVISSTPALGKPLRPRDLNELACRVPGLIERTNAPILG